MKNKVVVITIEARPLAKAIMFGQGYESYDGIGEIGVIFKQIKKRKLNGWEKAEYLISIKEDHVELFSKKDFRVIGTL